MNTNLQQDICDVLGTISPNEKTVKNYEGLSNSNEDTQTFLSLLKSPFVFKSIVCLESPKFGFAKQAFRLLQNGMVVDEWMELRKAYLSQILNFFTDHSSVISDYVVFETELADNAIEAYPDDKDVFEDAKTQRFELEEKLVKHLNILLENDEVLENKQQEIRYLLETIVILNTAILEDPFFENLFERQKPVLRALLLE